MHPDLIETLRLAQRLGFFGARPIEEAVEHAQGFVDALAEVPSGARLIDLGSGGGLPGLVIADARRDLEVLLVDRREKRTDFLRRAVRRLELDHVDVRAGDVDDVVRDVSVGRLTPYDVVTARGFGPPAVTLRFAAALLAAGGRIVISEPPSGDRWDHDLLDQLGLASERMGQVRVFTRG